MRYYSAAADLLLITLNGTAKYRFKNHVLIVGGAPTGTAAGTVILPELSPVDETKTLHTVDASGGTDLAKVGMGTLFWEAPEIVAGGSVLTVGNYYRVLRGVATHATVNYKAGTRFKATATALTGTGVVAFEPDWIYYKEDDINDRKENFKTRNLAYGDESKWDDSVFAPEAQSPTFVR